MSPAELLLGRQPRTKFELLRPNAADRVESKQQRQKDQHDGSSRDRGFSIGDLVYAKNFGQGQRWWPGKVVEVTGPVSYRVSLESGHIVRRHQDHMRIRRNGNTQEVEPETTFDQPVAVEIPPSEADHPRIIITESTVPVEVPATETTPTSDGSVAEPTSGTIPEASIPTASAIPHQPHRLGKSILREIVNVQTGWMANVLETLHVRLLICMHASVCYSL